MKVLVGCERSQAVASEFRALGHEAYSNDIGPEYGGQPEWHLQMDVFEAIKLKEWDLAIFHPPCERLTVTANRWYKPEYADRFPNIQQQRKDAINFFLALYNCHIPRIAIENPVGIMSTVFRKPDQIVHPYYFGDPHSKKTCLWLKGLPKLVPSNIVEPLFHTYKDGRRDPLWHYETMRLPAEERSRIRSKTFPGLAKQMALQWGV